MNIVWTAISLVLTRCFAVYTQAQTQRTMLQQQMTSSLYDKMQDSQEGVISVITEVRTRLLGRITELSGCSCMIRKLDFAFASCDVSSGPS
jgi:hypothetical protein